MRPYLHFDLFSVYFHGLFARTHLVDGRRSECQNMHRLFVMTRWSFDNQDRVHLIDLQTHTERIVILCINSIFLVKIALVETTAEC